MGVEDLVEDRTLAEDQAEVGGAQVPEGWVEVRSLTEDVEEQAGVVED